MMLAHPEEIDAQFVCEDRLGDDVANDRGVGEHAAVPAGDYIAESV